MENPTGIAWIMLGLVVCFCLGPAILGGIILLIYTGVQIMAFIGEKFYEFRRKKKQRRLH